MNYSKPDLIARQPNICRHGALRIQALASAWCVAWCWT